MDKAYQDLMHAAWRILQAYGRERQECTGKGVYTATNPSRLTAVIVSTEMLDNLKAAWDRCEGARQETTKRSTT